jgi:hypothetical protein
VNTYTDAKSNPAMIPIGRAATDVLADERMQSSVRVLHRGHVASMEQSNDPASTTADTRIAKPVIAVFARTPFSTTNCFETVGQQARVLTV